MDTSRAGVDYKSWRDPVHGYVNVPRELLPMVSSPYVQRLRNISQNSRAMAAYPSLNGTRYEHALGTMELALRAWSHAWRNAHGARRQDHSSQVRESFRHDVEKTISRQMKRQKKFDGGVLEKYFPGGRLTDDTSVLESWVRDFPKLMEISIGAVALLHDVGHPPFSHVLEDCYEDYADRILGPGTRESFEKYKERVGDGKRAQFHEWAGTEMLSQILQDDQICSSLPRILIRELYESRSGNGWAAAIHGLIDGEIDVDRLDYICRDARRAGVDYHAIDVQRLLANLELHQLPRKGSQRGWTVGVGQQGISAVESLLIQRDQSYRWMIFHSKAIVADTALKRAVDLALASEAQEPESDLSWLDYVGDWGDGHSVGASFFVDDHKVLEWLRGHRPHFADASPPARRMRAYLDICDLFSTRAVASWRNYGEFVSSIKSSEDAVRGLAKLTLLDTEGADSGDARLVGGRVSVDISPRQSKHSKKSSGNGSSTLAQGLSIAMRDAWSGNHEKQRLPCPNIDLDLEGLLNERFPEVGGEQGLWLVAHRLKFDPIKANALNPEDDGLRLWNGLALERFGDLSPIFDGLMKSNVRRPMLWAFFLPDSPLAQVPRQAVRNIFINELVEYLTNHIRGE